MTQAIVDIGDPTQDRTPAVRLGEEDTKSERNFGIVTSIISVLWILAIIIANHNPVIHMVETRTSERIEFNLRESLGRTPPLARQVKLLAIDDPTFAFLGGPSPSLEDWAKVLTNIADKKPRAILMDKLFAETPADTPANRAAANVIKAIKVPLYSGAIYVNTRLGPREPITLPEETYGLERFLDDKAAPEDRQRDQDIFLNKQKYFVYGHARWFESLFRGVGHITYNDTDGRVPIAVRLNEKFLLPHMALMPFLDEIHIKDSKLTIAGKPVAIDQDGLSYFNHRPPQYFTQNARSMRFMIDRARRGIPEKSVEEGDIVLIPTHFTGGTDFHDGSPFGSVPGGYLIASLIDCALTGNWIYKFPYTDTVIVLLCMIGILVGTLSRPIAFWSIATTIALAVFCLGIALFSFQSIIFPWLMPMIGFIVSGMIHFANQSIQSEIKKVALKRDFYAEKARRLEEENKKIVLEESLKLGKVVQDLLLPKNYHGSFSQYTYDMKYTPSHIMGGDWLYIWNVSSEEQRIFMGDVMGKGPSAAIPVAIIIGVLKECEIKGLDMHEAIGKINQAMVDLFACTITSTCAAIVLRTSGVIDIYNAGTPGWVIAGPDGSSVHSMRSNPLGVTETGGYAKQSLDLSGNTIIFTFTDGYLEGSRAFRRLINKLDRSRAFEADSNTIHDILMASGEGHRLVDDRSLLAIKVA